MSDGRKSGRAVLQKAAKSVAAMPKRTSKASSTLHGQVELQRESKSLAAVSRVASTRRNSNTGSTLKGRLGSFVREQTKGSAKGSDNDEETPKWYVHCMRPTRMRARGAHACMCTCIHAHVHAHTHLYAFCMYAHVKCIHARTCTHANSSVTTCAHICAHSLAQVRSSTNARVHRRPHAQPLVRRTCVTCAHAGARAYARLSGCSVMTARHFESCCERIQHITEGENFSACPLAKAVLSRVGKCMSLPLHIRLPRERIQTFLHAQPVPAEGSAMTGY